MHRPIFGHSFAVFVAPVLLSVLAFKFLSKKKTSAHRDAKDVDISASDSITASIEANSDGSSPSPTKTDNIASSSSPKELNNGPSSSLTMSSEDCYEVFLSFRGPNTQKSFANHLYHGLLDAGIDVFRDNNELPQGKNIGPKLLAAITKSKILIPILFEEYGTSSWCLDELVQMMECKNNNGQIVLPIFYKVKPADVRHGTGSFGQAFHEHERRLRERSSFDPTILGKWKKALNEVSTLKGYEANGYEAELVKSIVRRALSELKKKFELVFSENLVGIDSHVSKIMEFMDNKSHATLFVGIHGMGGIGKTTLAKVIYNKLSNQFEHRSFIADVRESWKRNGIHYLQNKLVSDILNQKNEVRDQDEGTNFISSKFKGKKVLILLDDVDNVVQLKHLASNHEWFYPGSRIIITTRNKKILKQIGVDYAYDHREMDDVHSLILFSKHAFRRDSPSKEFKDLTHEVVSLIGGLPLSLEVLGSLLCGEKPEFWRETIDKLKKVPCKEVQKTLKISYEALDNEQKQIFLDIACFFIGTDNRIASYMWDACHFFPMEGIEVLRFMSLIKIGDDHQLQMHDHLRDLGRTIVHWESHWKPLHCSRLWDHNEVIEVLREKRLKCKIEAIDLSKEKECCIVLSRGEFIRLPNLRFLSMKDTHLAGDFTHSTELLRWLRWSNCPMDFQVTNFHVEELVILELPRSKINEKWGGWRSFMMSKKLKYLDLSYCESLEYTDFLSAFKKLEVLILNHCKSLKRIDASIGDMEALLRLDLRFCESLAELPVEIGKLKALQQLHLNYTRSLFALPDSIGSLENLEILHIFNSSIKELPNSFGRLRKLRELHAANCRNLKGIMLESMCNFSSLRNLDFSLCTELPSLPDLPSNLTDLGITCQSSKLPSLSHLVHLKKLLVWRCNFLECIQVLPSMLLKNLECSQPMDVEESESPQSLNTPFKMEFLDVITCRSIRTLDVSQFIHLRTLSIQNCNNLLEVQGLDKLIYLESLTLFSCYSIERLDLPKFEGLKKLNVEGRDKLAEIQSLDKSEYLESLDIELHTSTERLDLPECRRLKKLRITDCKNLAEIEGLDRSECLESLVIGGCTSIERLDLPKFGRLKELNAGGCENLAEIQGLDSLEYLESLYIFGCTSIGRLDLPKSGSMKILCADSCKKLAKIQGLDGLGSLETLDISRCTSIERLLLPNTESLKILKAEDCENLVEIQGFDRLEFMKKMNIIACKSFKTLPELSRTQIYRYYEITDGKTRGLRPDYMDDSDE